MKKLLSLAISLIICVSMAGCSSNVTENTKEKPDTNTQQKKDKQKNKEDKKKDKKEGKEKADKDEKMEATSISKKQSNSNSANKSQSNSNKPNNNNNNSKQSSNDDYDDPGARHLAKCDFCGRHSDSVQQHGNYYLCYNCYKDVANSEEGTSHLYIEDGTEYINNNNNDNDNSNSNDN